MIEIFGRSYEKDELLRYVGDISQIAGVQRKILWEGNSKGVEAIDVWTGSGFRFTVLPDRGMDVSFAEWRGIPLCWRSPTGEVAPCFYEPEGLGWLRSFYGGLLVTCGLTYAGAPTVDEGQPLGLHGRISNIPARNVQADAEWEEGLYMIRLQGRVREAAVFGDNLQLTREIGTSLGEKGFFIHDTVQNLGYQTSPLMILYHINIGFPVVDEGAELVAPSIEVRPRDEEAKKDQENYGRFHAPTAGYREKVYYHTMRGDPDDRVLVGVINRNFQNGQGIGVYVEYWLDQLDQFVQWKMMGEGTYAVGLEPANCLVEGRDKCRREGKLQFLSPGEKREFDLQIGVLTSLEEIEEFERTVRSIQKGSENSDDLG